MHKNMPATTWQALVHVFNFFTCLLDRGGSPITIPKHQLIKRVYVEMVRLIIEKEEKNNENAQ